MKTINTLRNAPSHIKIQEGSYGKIKRTYTKPNVDIGYYESLSLIK
ncbi:MAG: hypothetical protein KJN85_17355 [Maribacter sp.]|nr:hypothetical protein [Maribacter sp.]MBT8315807.1 hypothetical protein [Maribacter sp.]